MTGTLDNTGVLITRPAHQADHLMSLIELAGGQSFLFPTIEIQPLETAALQQALTHLPQADIAIFVSANSVTFGFEAMAAHRVSLPTGLSLAAVGATTARALEARARAPDIVPDEDFRSESLLAHPALQQIKGKRIFIFRGEGGRELLGTTLLERGALVEYAECYRRAKPDTDAATIEQHWAAGEIDVVTATSVEGIKNLFDLLGAKGKALMQNTAIVVISQRMADACRSIGLKGPIQIAAEASDSAIVDALETWRRQQKSL